MNKVRKNKLLMKISNLNFMKKITTIITSLLLGAFLSLFLVIPLALATDETAVTNPCDEPTNLTADQKLECLFPDQVELIQNSPQANTDQGNVSLPSGHITEDFLPFFINTALSLAGTLVFIAIFYAGYLLVAANDDEEAISKGKRILSYSAIGIALIAASYAIIYGVATLDLD